MESSGVIMIRFFLIILLFITRLQSFGQQTNGVTPLRLSGSRNLQLAISKKQRAISDTTHLCICCRHRGDTSELPLFVLNDNLKTNHFEQFVLNPLTIEHIDILNFQNAIERFGQQAKYGALIIKLNDSTKLFTLSNLLDHFNIKQEDRNLPICLNEVFITESSNVHADIAAIKKIEIKKGRYWFYVNRIATPCRFINIMTK